MSCAALCRTGRCDAMTANLRTKNQEKCRIFLIELKVVQLMELLCGKNREKHNVSAPIVSVTSSFGIPRATVFIAFVHFLFFYLISPRFFFSSFWKSFRFLLFRHTTSRPARAVCNTYAGKVDIVVPATCMKAKIQHIYFERVSFYVPIIRILFKKRNDSELVQCRRHRWRHRQQPRSWEKWQWQRQQRRGVDNDDENEWKKVFLIQTAIETVASGEKKRESAYRRLQEETGESWKKNPIKSLM